MNSMKDMLSNYNKVKEQEVGKRKREEENKKTTTHSSSKISSTTTNNNENHQYSKKSTQISVNNSDTSNNDSSIPPHFLIVGAQKAGTMAAVKNLNKHSSICVLSEIHFFDLGWNNSTPQIYRNLLKKTACEAGSNKIIIGEKTPEYIYVDECAIRIKEVCPKTKFIFFIRDPIKRAYSGWNMNHSKGRESEPFDACVETNMLNVNEYRSYGTAEFQYVQRGFYLDQIERFLKIFPDKNNLLIVVAEHIRKEPEIHYRKIFDFLGVKNEQLNYEVK